MSMIETAVLGSKKIEGILKVQFQAEGKGLHEYLTSVENRIPPAILKRARYVASVRNKVVHENGEINDISDFNQTVENVVSGLENVIKQEKLAAEELRKRLAEKTQSTQQSSHGKDSMTNSQYKRIISVLCIVLFISFVLTQQRTTELKSEKLESSSRVSSLSAKVHVLKSDIRKKDERILDLTKKLTKLEQEYKQLLSVADTVKKTSSQPEFKIEPGKKTLLAQAMASGSEYGLAVADIKENVAKSIKKNTTVTTGTLEVSQDSDGTFSVRVPVSWNISGSAHLQVINKYFNSYDGKPIALSSDSMRGKKNRIVVSQRYADSSSSPKPYSGRLYDVLQGVEIRLVASIGNKSSYITLAGNGRCHVSCNYSKKPSDSWLMQVSGAPGQETLSYKQETPIVIKGLTKKDLEQSSEPIIKLVQL